VAGHAGSPHSCASLGWPAPSATTPDRARDYRAGRGVEVLPLRQAATLATAPGVLAATERTKRGAPMLDEAARGQRLGYCGTWTTAETDF
jgi:hypothetical protein